MPKPIAPWIEPKVLKKYVYVLTGTYVPDSDEGVVFYAKTSSGVKMVRVDDVLPFLEKNRDKVFITYDAPGFHETCLQALHIAKSGDDYSSLVWGLSQECRLWDVGLLEMRIQYAHAGFVRKISGAKGWKQFLQERGGGVCQGNVNALFDAIRLGFVTQINWAMENLPLFKTYRSDLIPSPVTVDEYCDLLDSGRAWRFQHLACGSLPGSEREANEGALFLSSIFRRRDIALTGRYGPFGIGLDVKSAIVAAYFNSPTRDVRPDWANSVLAYAHSIYEAKTRLLHKPPWNSCFEWEPESHANPSGFQKIRLNEKCNIETKTEILRKLLTKTWTDRPSFITAPHTPPLDRQGKVSVLAADWLNDRFALPELIDWLELESANVIYRQRETKGQFNYASFPALRSLAPEVFADRSASPILQSATDHTFLIFQWPDLRTHTLICTLFAEYLLHRRYKVSYPPILSSKLDPVFSPLQLRLTDLETEESEYIHPLFHCPHNTKEAISIAEFLERQPPKKIMRIVSETLESFRHLEHADAYRQRLRRFCLFDHKTLDLIYWSMMAGTFGPFITMPWPHWSPIPNPTHSKPSESMQADELLADRPYFRSVNIIELMFEMTMNHFDSLSTGIPDYDGNLLEISKKIEFGWGFINNLHKTKYEYFIKQDEYDDYYELRNEVHKRGKDTVVSELPWTNTVSCNGRIGRPIRYYEWMDADACQLADDVKANVVHDLLAAGYDVVLAASGQVVLHVPANEDAKDMTRKARRCIEKSITQTLLSAFPSKNPPVDVFDYFVNGKLKYSTSSTWPCTQ